jgi:hypothetical protein
MKYDVISPDGFPISATETWDSVNDAQKALVKWMNGYKIQGYYSSNQGRIPINELESYCLIKPIEKTIVKKGN